MDVKSIAWRAQPLRTPLHRSLWRRSSQTKETSNEQICHPLDDHCATYGLADGRGGFGLFAGEVSVQFCAKWAKRPLGESIEQYQAGNHVFVAVKASHTIDMRRGILDGSSKHLWRRTYGAVRCGRRRARYGSFACHQHKRGDVRTPVVVSALELKQITNVQIALCVSNVRNAQVNTYIQCIALHGSTAGFGIKGVDSSKHCITLQRSRWIDCIQTAGAAYHPIRFCIHCMPWLALLISALAMLNA